MAWRFQYDEYSGAALSYRGEFHLARRDYQPALTDYEAAIPKSLECYRNYKGLATAAAGLGDVERAY